MLLSFFILNFFLLILLILNAFMHKSQNKINTLVSGMIKLNHEELMLRIKIKDAQIEKVLQKLEFLEKKQIEIRKNICLQNRKIDKISLEKLSNDDFTDALNLISNDFESSTEWETEFETKFALEMEDFRKTFERITKNHYKRIKNLENKNFSEKIFEEKNENIF